MVIDAKRSLKRSIVSSQRKNDATYWPLAQPQMSMTDPHSRIPRPSPMVLIIGITVQLPEKEKFSNHF